MRIGRKQSAEAPFDVGLRRHDAPHQEGVRHRLRGRFGRHLSVVPRGRFVQGIERGFAGSGGR
ncbi:MAG TPA: hypothetical protein VHD57_17150 [Vicinamibacterales bacterium]|jgi:hypothetical protein|nr:hypothetical protein [Vicinamibacterales bacterium]